MFDTALNGLSNFASTVSLLAYGFIIYELLTSLGPAEVKSARVEGSEKIYQLAVLKGVFRRRVNAQSIVRFADGTGMYFPTGRRFDRAQLGFEVDVVFIDGSSKVIAVSPGKNASPGVATEHKASSFFICNSGDADGLQVGQKLSWLNGVS